MNNTGPPTEAMKDDDQDLDLDPHTTEDHMITEEDGDQGQNPTTEIEKDT